MKGNLVTVCIAAACRELCQEKEEPRFVLCADRKTGTWMAGAQIGLKFRWAARNWPALIAGTVSRADELLATYRQCLKDVQLDRGNIFDEMKKPALLHKEKLADEYIRSKFGFSYEHLRKSGKKELPASLLYEAFLEIKNLDLGCSLLIAGFVQNQVQIFLVNENGTVTYHEHFGAIGTGGVIAESALYQREQESVLDLKDTLYSVYEAKKLAEIAEGVGEQTTVMIFEPPADKDGTLGVRRLNRTGDSYLQSLYSTLSFKKVIPPWDLTQYIDDMGRLP